MTRTIVFAPDEKFCKYFGVALQSLIDNSESSATYEIIIFDADISNINKNRIIQMLPPNFSLRFFNITEYLKQNFGHIIFKTTASWSLSTYYRLFLPMILQGYERVLYCDSDIIFNQPVDELFEMKFENNQIMAVLDTISPILFSNRKLEKHFINVLKLKNPEKYFNSGILMFNIPAINIEEYTRLLTDILQNINLHYLDQDALNIIFAGKTKYLSCRWNYQWGTQFQKLDYETIISGVYKKDFLSAKQNPAIIHYTTPTKPWNSPKEDFAEKFWHYARKCPFYEDLIFDIIKIGNINKFTTYLNYYTAKLLYSIGFGMYFKDKRDRYKQIIREVRKFAHL